MVDQRVLDQHVLDGVHVDRVIARSSDLRVPEREVARRDAEPHKIVRAVLPVEYEAVDLM